MQNFQIRPPRGSEQPEMYDADIYFSIKYGTISNESETAQFKLYINELQWVFFGGGGTHSK